VVWEMPENKSKAIDIWQKSRDAIDFRRQHKDALWIELDAFDRGEQWTQKGVMPSWIPRPSSNYISKVKRYKTGSLMIENYLGELKPLAPENEPQIYMLQRFYEQLWDKLNVKYHLLDAIRTSRLLGTGILYVGWDENYIGGTRGHLYQGEILVKEIEPSTFFIDPAAFDLEEAMYCGTFVRTTKEQLLADPSIEAKYKKQFKENRKVTAYGMQSEQDRGEIFQNRDYSSYQDHIVDLITFYEKVLDDDFGFRIDVTTIADGVIIKKIEGIQPNLFPFVILRQHKARQDFWGISDAQLILPNVKMINKVQSIIGTLATLYQNPQKIVFEGAGIDPRIISKYGNAFGLVYLSKSPDLSNVIRNVDVADIPQTLLGYIEFLKADIEDFTGMTDFATGQNSRSVQTTGGVNSMIERSLVQDQDEFILFEAFIEKLSHMLLLNSVEYYTDNRVMRMKSEDPNNDAEYEYVPFDFQQFQSLAWDFSLDIVNKIRNTQESKQQVMQMLSEWQLQYSPGVQIVTPEDIVRAFNPANRDVILARIKQETQQKSFEMASTIAQQAVQAMQTGYTPEMIAEMVFEILNPQQQELGDVQKRQEGLVNNSQM
jgi:hypothetical protein